MQTSMQLRRLLALAVPSWSKVVINQNKVEAKALALYCYFPSYFLFLFILNTGKRTFQNISASAAS